MLRQRLTLNQFHGQKRRALVFMDRIDGGDAGMVEGRQRLGLAAKAAEPLRIFGKLSGEDLDGHFPVQLGIQGPPHLSHASLADRSQEAIVQE